MAANEIRSFAVTVPAGTPVASPAVTSLAMPPRVVTAVRWRVPPGPLGLVGWALSMAGNNVIPYGSGNWIVANDEASRWTLEDAPTSGAWTLTAYNTGTYNHTIYLDFELDVIPTAVSAAVTPIPSSSLTGTVSGALP